MPKVRNTVGEPAKLLADLVELQSEAQTDQPCPLGRIMLALSPEERDLLQEMLNTSKIPTIKILRTLRRNGYRLGDGAIYSHRRSTCTCAGRNVA